MLNQASVGAVATLSVNRAGGKGPASGVSLAGASGTNPYLAHRADAGATAATGQGGGQTGGAAEWAGKADAEGTTGSATGYDPRLTLKQRDTRGRKSFAFVKAGTYVNERI